MSSVSCVCSAAGFISRLFQSQQTAQLFLYININSSVFLHHNYIGSLQTFHIQVGLRTRVFLSLSVLGFVSAEELKLQVQKEKLQVFTPKCSENSQNVEIN